MKKVILSLLTILLFSVIANAQTNPPEKKMADLTNRPSDHLILQSGVDFWVGGGGPDSVKTSGTGRHFNIYFMMDKPFKSNNKFSLAYGIGFGTNNQYIDKGTSVDLAQSANTIRFKQSIQLKGLVTRRYEYSLKKIIGHMKAVSKFQTVICDR